MQGLDSLDCHMRRSLYGLEDVEKSVLPSKERLGGCMDPFHHLSTTLDSLSAKDGTDHAIISPYNFLNSRITSSGTGGSSANKISFWLFSKLRFFSNKICAAGWAVTGTTKDTMHGFGRVVDVTLLDCEHLRARAAARLPPAEHPHSAIRFLSMLYSDAC